MPSRDQPAMADPITITEISERHWTVEVEQTALCRLTLTNGGHRRRAFVVEVMGVPASWVALSPPQVELEPGEWTAVMITITPPRQPAGRAGVYPVTIVVSSPEDPGPCSRHSAMLVVKPYYEFALGELTPRRISLSRFKHFGQTAISIVNKSNTETSLRLAGADELNGCRFEFWPPGEGASLVMQVELRLGPGETVTMPVQITPPPRPLIGLGRRVFPFTLTTTILAGRPTSRSVLGHLESSPLIGPWLTSLLTVGLAVLLMFSLQAIITYSQATPRPTKTGRATGSGQTTSHALNVMPFELPVRPAAEAAPVPESEMTYEEMFQEIAPQYGLDWRLLAELAYQESRMNPLALGRDNDMGLMQIVPATWQEWAPKVGVSDPFDPYSNVLVGAAYLAYVRDYSLAQGYSEEYWALIGYNWGPDNLRQLFENNGGFNEVPDKQRLYALTILQARAEGLDRWREPPP